LQKVGSIGQIFDASTEIWVLDHLYRTNLWCKHWDLGFRQPI